MIEFGRWPFDWAGRHPDVFSKAFCKSVREKNQCRSIKKSLRIEITSIYSILARVREGDTVAAAVTTSGP